VVPHEEGRQQGPSVSACPTTSARSKEDGEHHGTLSTGHLTGDEDGLGCGPSSVGPMVGQGRSKLDTSTAVTSLGQGWAWTVKAGGTARAITTCTTRSARAVNMST